MEFKIFAGSFNYDSTKADEAINKWLEKQSREGYDIEILDFKYQHNTPEKGCYKDHSIAIMFEREER